jgi:hypothetical protein
LLPPAKIDLKYKNTRPDTKPTSWPNAEPASGNATVPAGGRISIGAPIATGGWIHAPVATGGRSVSLEDRSTPRPLVAGSTWEGEPSTPVAAPLDLVGSHGWRRKKGTSTAGYGATRATNARRYSNGSGGLTRREKEATSRSRHHRI